MRAAGRSVLAARIVMTTEVPMMRPLPEIAPGGIGSDPTSPNGTSPAPTEAAKETLKSFIAGNMPLLTTFTVLAGLAGFVLTLPLGWFGPLLRAGLLVLTVIVWFDLLDQLPAPLLLSRWRHYPVAYNWRLIWFAYLIQFLMIGFLVFMCIEFPRVAAPAFAAVAAMVVVSRLGDRVGGLVRLVIALIVFELALVLLYPTHQGVSGWLLEHLR